MKSRIEIKQLDKGRTLNVAFPNPLPRISSPDLLGSRGELIIDHDGREYHLRLTQNGKLILTA